jgi:hypothetical protein
VLINRLSSVRNSNPNGMRNALLSVGTISKNSLSKLQSPKSGIKKSGAQGVAAFPQTSRATFVAAAVASGEIALPRISNMKQ